MVPALMKSNIHLKKQKTNKQKPCHKCLKTSYTKIWPHITRLYPGLVMVAGDGRGISEVFLEKEMLELKSEERGVIN